MALADEFNAEETVARFGGDEFVVVCPGATHEMSRELLASALDAVERCTSNDRHLSVSASVGVAIAGPRSTAEDLLRGADIAMYRAKEQGGNCYELFDERPGSGDPRASQPRSRAAQSRGRREFEVHYQPQVTCTGGF